MNVEDLKDQIEELWSEEAREIIALHKTRQQRAEDLKAAWNDGLREFAKAEKLREQADPLIHQHATAGISGDDEQAASIQAQYKDLQDEAATCEERAANQLARLKEQGVEGTGRDELEKSLDGILAALKSPSSEELRILTQVENEVNQLLKALLERADPFLESRPGHTEKRQLSYELRRAG